MARDAHSNTVYNCQLIRGLYQDVTVQDVTFENRRFPRRDSAQAAGFSVSSEHRDILTKLDASRIVSVTEKGAWAEEKVRKALISKFAIDNSWFPVMCRTGSKNLVRYNNVGLYAKGFHLLSILEDADDSGNVALPGAWAQYNTIDITVAVAAPALAAWNDAIISSLQLFAFTDSLSNYSMVSGSCFLLGASSLKKVAFNSPVKLQRRILRSLIAVSGLTFNRRNHPSQWAQRYLKCIKSNKIVIWHDCINNSVSKHQNHPNRPIYPVPQLIEDLNMWKQKIAAIVYLRRLGTSNMEPHGTQTPRYQCAKPGKLAKTDPKEAHS